MKIFWLASKYLVYLFHSKTRFGIHSPFVFDLVNKVLKDKKKYPEYAMPDKTLRKFRKRTDIIETTDFGDRAGNRSFVIVSTTVGKIVRQRSHTRQQMHLLLRLSRYFQPKTILEMGTAAGISTIYLASGCPGCKIVTLEGCVGLSSIAEEGFEKRKLNNIEVVTGNFDLTLPAVIKNIDRLGMVYFDGNHRELPTLHYFQQCLELADENSVFIFDDIHWSPGMESAWKQIKENEQVSITIDLFWAGLVFFRKGVAKQNFIIR